MCGSPGPGVWLEFYQKHGTVTEKVQYHCMASLYLSTLFIHVSFVPVENRSIRGVARMFRYSYISLYIIYLDI